MEGKQCAERDEGSGKDIIGLSSGDSHLSLTHRRGLFTCISPADSEDTHFQLKKYRNSLKNGILN